jgi:hypothetical protein
MSRSVKVDGTQVLLLGVAWLTFMQKCTSVEDIWKVFHKMPLEMITWDMWNVGKAKGVGTISIMQHKDRRLNSVKFCGVLNACAIIVVLEEWGLLMKIESGWDLNDYVWN